MQIRAGELVIGDVIHQRKYGAVRLLEVVSTETATGAWARVMVKDLELPSYDNGDRPYVEVFQLDPKPYLREYLTITQR